MDDKKAVQRKPYGWERGFDPNPLAISALAFGIVGIQVVRISLVRRPSKVFSEQNAAFRSALKKRLVTAYYTCGSPHDKR